MMELNDSDGEYNKLLCHIDDLKKICEKLKLNVNLLEIPINSSVTGILKMADSSDDSSESASSLSSDDGSSDGSDN